MSDTAVPVIIDNIEPKEVFALKPFDKFYRQIKALHAQEAAGWDLTTKAGRDACRSFAYKIAQAKTKIEKFGKERTATLRAQVKESNEVRDFILDQLDALQKEVRKPVTDLEDLEAQQKANYMVTEADITRYGALRVGMTAYDVQAAIDVLNHMTFSPTQQGDDYANLVMLAAEKVGALEEALPVLIKQEADAAELADLRAKADEEARIAQEAARKAEADRQEEIRRQEAVERALAKQADDHRVELAAIAKKAADDAEAARQAARQAEIDMLAQFELSRQNRKILDTILNDLIDVCKIEDAIGRNIVRAIRDGKIRHVAITREA